MKYIGKYVGEERLFTYYCVCELGVSILPLFVRLFDLDLGTVPHSWLFTVFVTRLTRQVSLVEQERLLFRSTWVHPLFLVGFVLLELQLFYMYVL
jgi:hypothetical protein